MSHKGQINSPLHLFNADRYIQMSDQISPLSNNMESTQFISYKNFNREKPLSFDELMLWVKKQVSYFTCYVPKHIKWSFNRHHYLKQLFETSSVAVHVKVLYLTPEYIHTCLLHQVYYSGFLWVWGVLEFVWDFFLFFIKKASKPVFADQKLSPNYRILCIQSREVFYCIHHFLCISE